MENNQVISTLGSLSGVFVAMNFPSAGGMYLYATSSWIWGGY